MATDSRFIKRCRVCGDRALSFNFNGLSCESCKIFFRRNALKAEEFTCYHGGSCHIDMVTRKTCQRCRLDKCFLIGMRKDLIVTRGKQSLISANSSSSSSTTSSPPTATSSAYHHHNSSLQSSSSPFEQGGPPLHHPHNSVTGHHSQGHHPFGPGPSGGHHLKSPTTTTTSFHSTDPWGQPPSTSKHHHQHHHQPQQHPFPNPPYPNPPYSYPPQSSQPLITGHQGHHQGRGGRHHHHHQGSTPYQPTSLLQAQNTALLNELLMTEEDEELIEGGGEGGGRGGEGGTSTTSDELRRKVVEELVVTKLTPVTTSSPPNIKKEDFDEEVEIEHRGFGGGHQKSGSALEATATEEDEEVEVAVPNISNMPGPFSSYHHHPHHPHHHHPHHHHPHLHFSMLPPFEEDHEDEEEEEVKEGIISRGGGGGSFQGHHQHLMTSRNAYGAHGSGAFPLRPYESHCLEVIKKVHLLFAENPVFGIPIVGFADNLLTVFNNQEYLIQDTIAFTKSIGGFQSLSPADQTAVFKRAFPDILLLRSAYFFHFDKNAFLARVAHRLEAAVLVRLELFYGPNACEPIYYHRQLAYMVKEEVESDLIIRDLLCVLLMFRPPDLDGTENFGLGVQPSTSTSLMAYSSNSTTSNTTSNTTPTSRYPEFIRYQYHSYCHLLRQYLGHKYASNARKAAERYSRLMVIVSKVATFKTAAISAVALQERVDVSQCSHLLAEIYFLKDGVPGLGGGQGGAGGLTAGGSGGDHRHDRGGDGTGGGGGGGGNGGGSINDGRNSYVNENSYSSHGSSGSNGGGGSSGSNGGGNGDNGNGGGGGGGNGERKNGCSLSPLEDRKFGIAAF